MAKVMKPVQMALFLLHCPYTMMVDSFRCFPCFDVLPCFLNHIILRPFTTCSVAYHQWSFAALLGVLCLLSYSVVH